LVDARTSGTRVIQIVVARLDRDDRIYFRVSSLSAFLDKEQAGRGATIGGKVLPSSADRRERIRSAFSCTRFESICSMPRAGARHEAMRRE
jgi:hypothetical protein